MALPVQASGTQPEQGAAEPSMLSIGGMLGLCRRHFGLLLGWIVFVMLATFVLVQQFKPVYTGEAELLLQTTVTNVTGYQSVVETPANVLVNMAIAKSESEVLKSRLLAQRVINKLDLMSTPDFQPQRSYVAEAQKAVGRFALATLPLPVVQTILPPDWIRAPRQATPEALLNKAVDYYLSKLDVQNDGRSFTFLIDFSASDPELAARITNAHAEAYLADQRGLKETAAKSASDWISKDIEKLRADLSGREAEMRTFREHAGLLDANGATALAHQVQDVAGQLASAQADMAQNMASYGATQNGPGRQDAQSAILNSPLIASLRVQETQARQDAAQLGERLGPNHPEVHAAAARVAEIGARIASESAKLIRGVDNSARIAQQRLAELDGQMAKLERKLAAQVQAQSQLSVMQQDAAATRSVYTQLLTRQHEIDAEIGAERSDSRLISPAAIPTAPSFPNLKLMMAAAFLVAACSGVGLAILVDQRGEGIKRPDELDAFNGAAPLHSLPFVSAGQRRRIPLIDYVLSNPKSEFSEAVRSLRGDMVRGNRKHVARTIAITSALPREGKTTVAIALARSMTGCGLQVLLIDGDLRRPSIATSLGLKDAECGIVAVLGGQVPLQQAAIEDPASGLRILVAEKKVQAPQDLLGGDTLPRILSAARRIYDVIIIDTPPAGAVTDALLIVPHVDATVMVVRWKTTPISILRATLRRLLTRTDQSIGMLLNGVDGRVVARTDKDMRRLQKSAREYYLQP